MGMIFDAVMYVKVGRILATFNARVQNRSGRQPSTYLLPVAVVHRDVKVIAVPRVKGLGGIVSHLPVIIRDLVGAGPSRERAHALPVLYDIHARWAVASQAERAGLNGITRPEK